MSNSVPYKYITGYQKIIDHFNGFVTYFHDEPIIEFSKNGTEVEFVIGTIGIDVPEEYNPSPIDVRIKCHNVTYFDYDEYGLSCLVLSELITEKTDDGKINIGFEGCGGNIICSNAEAFIEPIDVTKNRYSDIIDVEKIFDTLGEYPRFRGADVYHNDNTSITLHLISKKQNRKITIAYSNEEINCDYDDTKHRFSKFSLTELWTHKTTDCYVIIDLRGTGYSIKCKNPYVSKIE